MNAVVLYSFIHSFFSLLICTIFYYTNCVTLVPFCSLFFLRFFRLYDARIHRENADHHIIFDVTIDVCIRVLRVFFLTGKFVLSVSRSWLFIFYIYVYVISFFCVCHASEGKRRESEREQKKEEPVLSFAIHYWLAIAQTRPS